MFSLHSVLCRLEMLVGVAGMPKFSQVRKSMFVSALESIVVPVLWCNPWSSLWVGVCFPSAGTGAG